MTEILGSEQLGEVTFLFTDVEQSSLNWIEREEEMSGFIPAVSALIESIGAAAGGELVGKEGDGRSLMFEDPEAALNAAVSVQRRLTHDHQATGGLRVRIGLHTGPVRRLFDGDLGGTSINFVGRMHKVGHGGQIIVSDYTRQLATANTPDGREFLDLGVHSLRDFGHQRIWQVVHPGLERSFAPLNCQRRYETAIPRLPSLIGRTAELAMLESLLDKPLITIAGPGGIGKTRLVQQLMVDVGHRFPDGVAYVELQQLDDPGDVGPVVANTLGVDAAQISSAEESIAEALEGSRMLLVLDNAEHLMDGIRPLCTAIGRQRGPVVVVTSRVPVELDVEHVVPLPPLAVVGRATVDGHETPGDAVELLMARSQELGPHRELSEDVQQAAIRICEQLDGIPLAIELIASWTRVMTLVEIERWLSADVDLLDARSGGPRQSMGAAVRWSVANLPPDARRVLGDLAWFYPGAALDELEAVVNRNPIELLGLLDVLVERSLVQIDRDCAPYRYRLLEPLRRHVRRSEDADRSPINQAHAEVYLDLVMKNGPLLRSDEEVLAVNSLTAELGNIRVALTHALEVGERERAARAVYELHEFSFLRMRYELYSWAERVVRSGPLSSRARAEMLALIALGAFNRGEVGEAERHGIASQEAARDSGMAPPIYSCFALITAFGMATDYDRANEQFKLAVDWEGEGATYFRVNSLVLASMAMTTQGVADVGAELALNALSIANAIGNPSSIAWSLAALASARGEADPGSARADLDASLRLARTSSSRWIEGQVLLNLTTVERHAEDWQAAAHACISALAYSQQVPNPILSRQVLRNAFVVLCQLGQYRQALPLLETVRRGAATVPPTPSLNKQIARAVKLCEATLDGTATAIAYDSGRLLNERTALASGRSALQHALGE